MNNALRAGHSFHVFYLKKVQKGQKETASCAKATNCWDINLNISCMDCMAFFSSPKFCFQLHCQRNESDDGFILDQSKAEESMLSSSHYSIPEHVLPCKSQFQTELKSANTKGP